MSVAARVAGGVLAAAFVLLAAYLLLPRDYYTGSNAIRTRGMLIELNQRGDKLCFPGIEVPAGTGRMEFEIDTGGGPRPPMRFELELGGRTLGDRLPAGPPFRQKVAFAFDEVPGGPEARDGRACVTMTGEGRLFFGGVPGVAPGEISPMLNGRATGIRASIWYRPPAGEKASILFQLPLLFERMSRFRPSWVGPWTYWLLFLVVVPGLVFAAVRLVVHPGRRLPLLIGLLAFANAASWAHITPAFNAPDESEHFAYTQSLAERGKPLESIPGRPTYSSEEALGIRMTRVLDGAETPDGKPPWLASEDRTYERLADEPPPEPRDDGGGFAAAGSSHSPIFYALGIPAYAAGGDGALWDKLTLVRLVSALLGGIVAACAALIMLELAPTRRRLAAAAGVAVAFQPMFAFMSGAVNNDMGVNAGAAVVTLLLVRLIKRGFGLPLVAGLGAALAVTPLLKATGFALYPAAVLAVLLAAWRFREEWRRVLIGAAVLVGAFAVVYGAWIQLSATLDRGTFTTPTGGAPGEGFLATQEPGGAAVYIWEIFLPRLPTMAEHWSQSWPAFDIYGLRGWGAFGWYAMSWDHIVYWVIMGVMLGLTALGLAGLKLRWERLRGHLPELLVLLAVVAGVILVMTAPYYSPKPQGGSYPIQGRYYFPAIGATAALFVGATTVLRHRIGEALAVGLSTAVVCLGYASLWLVLASFYFAA